MRCGSKFANLHRRQSYRWAWCCRCLLWCHDNSISHRRDEKTTVTSGYHFEHVRCVFGDRAFAWWCFHTLETIDLEILFLDQLA